MNSLKQQTLLAVLLLSHCIGSEQSIVGLIGGQNGGTVPFSQYAATVSPFTGVMPLSLSAGDINTVALNSSGIGLIGGRQNTNLLYGAFISSTNGIQNIPLPSNPNSFVNSVAINNGNLGLVGGILNLNGYAAFVSPTSVTPISITPSMVSNILTVALNDSGRGLIGGRSNLGSPYAAVVSSSLLTATPISLNASPGGSIESVAINNSGLGLVGGVQNASFSPYAAFVVNNSAIELVFNQPGFINSVAINNSNMGLIGGGVGVTDAYAAFVFPGSAPQSISGLPVDGTILSVALNTAGRGLIGGFNGDNMYAALVSMGGAPQTLAGLPAGEVLSVAINDFNQGLIGGTNFFTDTPYAAIVSPSGIVTPLNLGFTKGDIASVAINAFFLSQIPTQGLKGNNLIFADYINENAPQDAFYFVPSVVDGTLVSALESAAPTRNMISYNTVMQNSFYLTTNLSAHLRNQRLISLRAPREGSKKSTALLDMEEDAEGEFLASRCFQTSKKAENKCVEKEAAQKYVATTACPPKTMGIWVDVIGALAYQNAQHETPGFDPETLGGTIGFDGKMGKTFTIGGGGSYFYTHVHEKNHQGHSNIQQEDLFAYASWQPKNFYVDLGIWGGLFQTKQTRHIQMTGFDFKATSKPNGWQVVPHLELGFLATAYCTPKMEITWNLLGMADWANAWQHKYKEKGTGPFNVKQKAHYGSLLRAEGGLRLSETLFFKTWNLIFQEKGSYVNIQSFKAGKMQAFLIGSPGSFTVQTLTNAQNLGLVQLSVTAAPYKCCLPTSMILYQGEFGSGYQSHQMTLEFNWNF